MATLTSSARRHPHPQSVTLPERFGATELPVDLCFGGHEAILRWLQPDDAGRLIEFFQSHTPETIRRRYGYPMTQMTPERAAELVGVDQERDCALGVFEWWRADWHLIAIGRYCLVDEGHSGEAAFVVHEDRRRLGIATTLLQALTLVARQRGLRHLVAQVERDNLSMRSIFQRAGATMSSIEGTNALAFKIPVHQGELVAPGRR